MRGRFVGGVALGLVLATGVATGADKVPAPVLVPAPPPDGAAGERKKPANAPAIKKWLVQTVVDAARRGTALCRVGRYEECYQYYVATLFGILHYVDDDPLRGRVLTALFLAAQDSSYDRATVYLRTALNDVRNRNDFAPGKLVEKPLFERLGGREAVQSIVKMAYDKAGDKTSGVNLDRDGEFPYTADRARRMQQATVDLIKKLSDGRPAPAADPKPAGPDALGQVRAKLEADFRTALTALAALAPADPKRPAAVEDVVNLHKQLAALVALPPTVSAAPAAESDPAYLRSIHRAMRITDEEYSNALQVFRDALELHAIPEQEVDELIDVVDKLRGQIVYTGKP